MSDKTPVKKQAINKFAELGNTGLKHWSGRVDEEWLLDLKDEKKYRVYREMRDNDPIVGSILFTIEMLVRQVNWRMNPASDDEAAEETAEFVDECRTDMSTSWENTIGEILSMLVFGYSFHETIYKRRIGPYQKDPRRRSKFTDGKIGWRKLPIRAQDTLDHWEIDETGGVQAFVQQDPYSSKIATIPIEKGLLFRTSSHKGNPEGRSILRNGFRPWYFKKRIEEIEGIGVERDLAGLPVIYAPSVIMSSSASSEQQALYTAFKDMIRNIRRDEQEGIILPGDRDPETKERLYELVLLSTGGTRQFDTDKIVTRYDQRIAMTVLADFILLGHEKVGSFALSDSKTNLFGVALYAWLDEIKSVFNRFAIPRLLEVNGISLEYQPELEYEEIETPDLKVLGEYISKLAASGATLFPDAELENYLRRAGGMPERVEDEAEDGEMDMSSFINPNTTQSPAATEDTSSPDTPTVDGVPTTTDGNG